MPVKEPFENQQFAICGFPAFGSELEKVVVDDAACRLRAPCDRDPMQAAFPTRATHSPITASVIFS
jgi:hypothetical protein